MGFLLRNISGAALPINDLGVVIATGADLDLTQVAPELIAISSITGRDLETEISGGGAIVLDPDDDVTVLSIADSLIAVRSANLPHYRNSTGQTGVGGTILVEDEGTPLATAADTLDFAGAGVTASGTGTTKTITIPALAAQDLREPHSYAIAGEIKVPVGDVDFIQSFFVSLASGQTIDLVKARYSINSGTSATVKLTRNGVDITGYTGISVTTTVAETVQTQALADNDELALVVTGVSGTPTNLTFTLVFESPGGPAGGLGQTITFDADQLDDADTADWAVNAFPPAADDTNNSGLRNRGFDDTIEEGVGFELAIPVGTTSLKFTFVSRAETAPGAPRTVGLKLYERGIPDNVVVEAWSAGLVLTDLNIPANEFFQYDAQTVTAATLGVTAGQLHQFELTRIAPTAGTNLVGDWDLKILQVEFIF